MRVQNTPNSQKAKGILTKSYKKIAMFLNKF